MRTREREIEGQTERQPKRKEEKRRPGQARRSKSNQGEIGQDKTPFERAQSSASARSIALTYRDRDRNRDRGRVHDSYIGIGIRIGDREIEKGIVMKKETSDLCSVLTLDPVLTPTLTLTASLYPYPQP